MHTQSSEKIMENAGAKEFVQKIGALWGEQKKREALYLEALKKDDLGSLRKMLVQGHFSAVLFQREIRWIYDYFKCVLTDKDLRELNQTRSEHVNLMNGTEGKEQVLGILRSYEGVILNSYKSLIKHLEKDSETRKVLATHSERITEFYEILSNKDGNWLKMVNYTSPA